MNHPTSEERSAAHRRDFELVQEVMGGDPSALDRLIERLECVPRFLHSVNAKSGRVLNETELADLGQDVLILIWEKLSKFEGRATLETWTYRFCWLEARNRFRQVFRARKRSSSDSEGALEMAAAPTDQRAFEHDGLIDSLEELGPPASDVIRLKHFEERTFEEIGVILEIPANTAKTHYYRGLDWLRNRLRSRGEGEER